MRQSLAALATGAVLALFAPVPAAAQDAQPPSADPPKSDPAQDTAASKAPPWQYGGFIDVAYLNSFNNPSNHLFRYRGTTPRVDEWNVNMAAAQLKRPAAETSRLGVELMVQTGEDSKIFGFSATAPNIGGADALLHF